MKKLFSLRFLRDLLVIIFGGALYGFGVIFFNIPNDLAEGGVTGITLILRALFGLNPAITTLLLNLPLIAIGGKTLGKRSLFYTILGTASLSFWLGFWQKVPLSIDINHDLLIAAILGGILSGVGCGMIYRVGGTTGGSDIIARILELKFGISVGKTLLIFDIIVLTLSLSYINLTKMMYTLILAYVFSKLIDSIVDGGYSAKGIFVFSNDTEMIAPLLMTHLERGVTFFDGEGAYSKHPKKIIYIVVTPREIREVKQIVHQVDPKAFVSVSNVHEVSGEGFSYGKPKLKLLGKK